MTTKALFLLIALLSLVLITFGELELIELRYRDNYKYMRVSGYLLQALTWILFWFKTRSEVNKK